MPSRNFIGIWVERTLVVCLALFILAVIIPSINPEQEFMNSPTLPKTFTQNKRVVWAYVGGVCLPVICIFFGQKRSRLLEIVGWTVLIGLVLMAFH